MTNPNYPTKHSLWLLLSFEALWQNGPLIFLSKKLYINIFNPPLLVGAGNDWIQSASIFRNFLPLDPIFLPTWGMEWTSECKVSNLVKKNGMINIYWDAVRGQHTKMLIGNIHKPDSESPYREYSHVTSNKMPPWTEYKAINQAWLTEYNHFNAVSECLMFTASNDDNNFTT